MTKEELKALGLSDEQIEKVVEDYGKNYVSKSQFNQKNEEAKALKAEIATARKETDDLRKSNKDNEDLVKQIDELKAASKARDEEYAAKIKSMQIDSIVNQTLTASKAKNNAAVRALLDLKEPELDGDTIKGLQEQIEKVKASDSYLFDTDETNIQGVTPAEGGDEAQGTSIQQQFAQALGL